jgi:AcrR family transcriptional regulator
MNSQTRKNCDASHKLLLVAAGELFASYGYDTVSTRMITNKAGLKLSSIHYHFGGKKNLYIEAFSYAKRRAGKTSFMEVVAENPDLLKTPEGQSEIIRSTVFRRFHDNFRPDRPAWETQLLVREVVSPSCALPLLSEKVFKPEIEATEAFFKQIRPHASAQEVSVWSDMFYAQLFFYSMAKKPMELIRKENPISVEFLRKVSHNLSRALILLLGLPLPRDLR